MARKSTKTFEERFWEKVAWQGKGPDECWPWVAGCTGNGYGAFSLTHGKQIGAHIFAFEWAYDYVPDEVCHTCDNTLCCNPSHVFPGDPAINAADKVLKERQARGEDIGVLTREDVLSIRSRRAAGERLVTLSAAFGVHLTTISNIARGNTWGHVGGPIVPRGKGGRRCRIVNTATH